MHSGRVTQLFKNKRCADGQRQPPKSSSISIELPCFWLASPCYVVAYALWHWGRGTSCHGVGRSTLRRRTKLVASVALGPDGLRQLSLSVAIVLCRQRPFDQPRLAYRGWLVRSWRLCGTFVFSIYY